MNSNVLKSVLGFEIDSKNRMWILDMALIEGNIQENEMKLILWDLTKNELIKQYIFKKNEIHLKNSFLNDLVVDDEKEIAFISDSGIPVSEKNSEFKPALLVYELKHNRVRRLFESHKSMMPDPKVWIVSNSKKCFEDSPMKTGVDGIALSCDKRTLYWTPLTSRELFSIEIEDLLRNDETKIKLLGNKRIASDGLICSNKKECFVTDIETNSIFSFNQNFNNSYKRLIRNDQFIVWPDTFVRNNFE
jgi:sugar lactone lactonase YvrE